MNTFKLFFLNKKIEQFQRTQKQNGWIEKWSIKSKTTNEQHKTDTNKKRRMKEEWRKNGLNECQKWRKENKIKKRKKGQNLKSHVKKINDLD